MPGLQEYHLHENMPEALQFEMKEASAYIQQHEKHCFIPHRHSFYQLIWFQEEGVHYVDYEAIKHPENALFFIQKNQVHHFDKGAANKGYLFHFNQFFLHREDSQSDLWLSYKLFGELGEAYVSAENNDLESIGQLTALLASEVESTKDNASKQIYHLFSTILLKVERLRQKTYPDYQTADLNLKKVLAFKQLIESNLNQNLTIDAYAEKLGLSSKSLSNHTKKYFNRTPADMIQDRKLLEAKRLLSNRQLSIQEVAYQLGFTQPTYFTKTFKKATGLTPKAFIEKVSG